MNKAFKKPHLSGLIIQNRLKSERKYQMSELVTVTAQIPPDRISDFYKMVADLNRPEPIASSNQSPRSWSKGDEQQAKQVFATCSSNAKKFLSYLADRPGQQVSGEKIAEALALSKGSLAVAGILVSVSKHCKKVERERPYELNYARDATAGTYTMSKEVAELFQRNR
jgi:predicted AAA+ superfamily ATPase